jgi:glycosyltransferase involved in cell wall biosynthesis
MTQLLSPSSRSPKVSVVIPNYNRVRFIRAALESVLGQTYENIEIIVSDDGSTDGSQDIIQELARQHSNIITVYAPMNRGITSAVNAGFEKCTGEYVIMFDSDDVMFPAKLATQVAILEQRPDCGICSHDEEIIDANGDVVGLLTAGKPIEGGVEIMFQTRWFMGPPYSTQKSSFLARASFMLASKYDSRLRIWNEWLHMIDCLAITGLRWIHVMEILGQYRRHSGQVTQDASYHKIGHEERMLVLAIASVRYPQLSGLIKNKREYLLFERLLFAWHSPKERKDLERQFFQEAGLSKWVYLKLAQAILRRPELMTMTRPARLVMRRIIATRIS